MLSASYSIVGNLEGSPIEGHGVIRADPHQGLGEIEVKFQKRPRLWDPRTIVLCCCSRAIGAPARQSYGAASLLDLSGGFITIGEDLQGVCRRASIVDDEGLLRAEISATSLTNLSGDNPYDRSRVVGGFSRMEPGASGVAAIETVSGIMLQCSPHLVTLTTTYDIVCEDGSTLHGTTYYPHFLPRPVGTMVAPQHFELQVEELSFDNETMFARTYASVTPIAMAFASLLA